MSMFSHLTELMDEVNRLREQLATVEQRAQEDRIIWLWAGIKRNGTRDSLPRRRPE